MANNFKDYILLCKHDYEYVLKFAFPVTESNVLTIERICQKYGLSDISKPVRLPIQKCPLDFKNVENVEVYNINITTQYPASTELFHQELRQALNVAEKLVVVRCKNDPYEKETTKINEIKDEQENDTYKTRLLNSQNEESADRDVADKLYGEKYNDTLKDVLDNYRKDEKERITKTAGDKTPKAENFNDNITKKSSKGPFTDVVRDNGSIVK
jgi:hypothetical protein